MKGTTSGTHILSKTVGVGSSQQDVEFDFTIRSLMATGVVRVNAEKESLLSELNQITLNLSHLYDECFW